MPKPKTHLPTNPDRPDGAPNGPGTNLVNVGFTPLGGAANGYARFLTSEGMQAEKDRLKEAIAEMRNFNKLAPTLEQFWLEVDQVFKNIATIKQAYSKAELSKEKAIAKLTVLAKRFDFLSQKILGQQQQAMSEIDRQRAELAAKAKTPARVRG